MSFSRHRLYFLSGILVLLTAGFVLSLRRASEDRRVKFSDGSSLLIRKVTYGKDNVYWHDPVRRMAADLVGNRGVEALDWLFSRLSGPATDSCVQSQQDHLVVFGDVRLVSGTTPSWEFTGIDRNGNESRPLETGLFKPSLGPSVYGPGVLADGTNVPNQWPVAVRIYERSTNGARKLLAQVPAKPAPR